jgi:hypothetical protein
LLRLDQIRRAEIAVGVGVDTRTLTIGGTAEQTRNYHCAGAIAGVIVGQYSRSRGAQDNAQRGDANDPTAEA